jgi:hypothetical protein
LVGNATDRRMYFMNMNATTRETRNRSEFNDKPEEIPIMYVSEKLERNKYSDYHFFSNSYFHVIS